MRIKLLLFQLVMVAQISAQSWFSEDAAWTYECCSDLFQPAYLKTSPSQDTVVNNVTARLMKGEVYYRYLGSNVTTTFEFEPFVAYEEDGLVFNLSENGSFDTLYNIHALPGDQWTSQTDYFIGPMVTTVLDTGTISIANKALKWIEVELVFSPDFIYTDTVVERIGPLNHYFLPWHTIYLAGGAGKARCYEDQDIDFYQAWDFTDDCEFLLSSTLETAGFRNHFKIYPNPSEDQFRIEYNREAADADFELEIYNAYGQRIYRRQFVQHQAIDLGSQTAGLLLVVVKKQGRIVFSERVLKR